MIRQPRGSPVSSNNLFKQAKYISWKYRRYCGKEFGLDWDFTAGFGLFDLGPNATPSAPDLKATRQGHLWILVFTEICCSLRSGNEASRGAGLCIPTFLPFLSQLSHFLPAWPGKEQHLLRCAWSYSWADWPVGSCLSLQIRDWKCFPFVGLFWGCESQCPPKPAISGDLCLKQTGLKVISVLKKRVLKQVTETRL